MKTAKWMDRFWKDFKHKDFIAIKILFFLLWGGLHVMLPFQTIHARSLGMTVEEIGIIYSVLPLVGIFAPSIAGMIADSLGNFKIFLCFTTGMVGLSSLLFLTIPAGRVVHNIPEELPLTLNCTRYNITLQINEPFSCDFANISRVEINVKRCIYSCLHKNETKIDVASLNKTWCSITENCDELNIREKLEIKTHSDEGYDNDTNIEITKVIFVAELINNGSVTELYMPAEICPAIQQAKKEIYYSNENSEKEEPSECWIQCDSITDRNSLCSNSQTIEIKSPVITIISYLIIRFLSGVILSSSIPLFEGAAAAILTEHKGDFGYQRMYGNLGMLIMTPISGKLIDLASLKVGKEDYSPVFYLACCIYLFSAFVITFLNLEFKKPSNRVVKDVKTLVVQPRVTCFLLFTLVSGTCYGFVENFLFWLLEDLNADKGLMGLTITVGSLFGLPLLMLSSYAIKRMGHVTTLCVAISFYIIRFLGYSFIQNPWMAMPFEGLESMTNSLMGVASVSYTAVLSNPSTVASLQGIYGGIYHGVGRGVGSLVGGYLIKITNIRRTFQIFAVFSLLASVAYFSTHWFIFRKNDRKTKIENTVVKEDEKK